MGHLRAVLNLVVLTGILSGCSATAPVQTASAPDGRPIPPAVAPACTSAIEGADQLQSPIVILGETHGTSETPALFADLVCSAATRHQGETVLVGLELPASIQPAIDLLLDGPDKEAGARAVLEHSFWHRETQDGRSSQAMLALLERLRTYGEGGMRLAVRAIDPDSAQNRDAVMAANLSESIGTIRPAQTLVLVGDMHSRVVKGYPWAPADDYSPLARVLRDKDPDVLGLHVTQRSGTAWICNPSMECGAAPLRPREFDGPTPRLALSPDTADKVGWSGTIFVDKVSASPPAIDAFKGGR